MNIFSNAPYTNKMSYMLEYCIALLAKRYVVYLGVALSIWSEVVLLANRDLWGAVLLFISKMWYHLAFDVISPWSLCDITLELSDITNWTKWYHLIIKVISHNCDNLVISPKVLYNYRLLVRSTHDHEDRVRYWLTDAEGGGQPIPDKVFMVMSRPKSKVYYCFIKLSGIYLHKDWNIHSYCFLSRPLS